MDPVGVIQGRRVVRQSAYNILFIPIKETNLYICLVPFWRYIELFVESRRFFPSHVYLTPPLVMVTPREFHQHLWRQKTRVSRYREAFNWRDDILSRTDKIEHQLEIDKQIHTDGHRTVAYTALAQRRAAKVTYNTIRQPQYAGLQVKYRLNLWKSINFFIQHFDYKVALKSSIMDSAVAYQGFHWGEGV